MINPNKVLKRLAKTEKYHALYVFDKDNSKITIHVSPKQADLIMYLKYLMKNNKPIKDREWDKLVEHIEEYGFERWEEGAKA